MNWKTVISEIKAGLGITQAQIAKRIGISQISVSDLETGRTKDPRYATGAALMSLHRKAARKLSIAMHQGDREAAQRCLQEMNQQTALRKAARQDQEV